MYLPRKQLPLIALILFVINSVILFSAGNKSWIGIVLLLLVGGFPFLILAYYVLRYIVIAVYSYFQIFREWLYRHRHK